MNFGNLPPSTCLKPTPLKPLYVTGVEKEQNEIVYDSEKRGRETPAYSFLKQHPQSHFSFHSEASKASMVYNTQQTEGTLKKKKP